MNTTERGTGRTLLLIHGLGGSWQSWSTVLNPLSASRKVIAVDLPGHGATLAESDSGTFDGLVGSVERYMVEAGLSGVDVVGSSMGARIALELARRGLVGNVVALDPGGFWRGWERTFFRTTIGASGRLLRAIRPSLPALSRNAASRTALLAQLSARPWALDGETVATELEGLSKTPTFDALVRSLATGPEQSGPPLPAPAGSSSDGAGTTGSASPDRLRARRQPFPAPSSTGLMAAGTFRCGTRRRRQSPSFSTRRSEAPPAGRLDCAMMGVSTHIRSFKAASSLPNFRHSFITEAEGLQLPS